MRYVEVILPLPLDGVFTYSLPDSMTDRLQAGMRVLVPLGRSKHYTGIALRMHDVKPDFEVKEVIAVMDERPLLLPVQLKLWRWMAEYYMAPLGDVYKAALPAGLKQEDGYRPRTETYIGLCEPWRNEQALHVALDMLGRALKQKKVLTEFLHLSRWDSIEGSTPTEDVHEVTREELTNVCHCTDAVVKSLIDRKILYTYQVEVGRLNTSTPAKTTQPKPLSAAQATAYNEMLLQLMAKEVVLLHGVTSSGKTELYIHLITKTIADGKQVLYLLPEIALPVQMMDRLRSVFGDRLGIYHSKYSDAERAEIWLRQLSDHPYDIILGARSAMFLPFIFAFTN